MKKQLTFFLIAILSIPSMAQTNFHHWQIGAIISPEYSNSDNYYMNKKGNIAKGLNIVYNFTDFLGFETNVIFSNKGFVSTEVEIGEPMDEGSWIYTFKYIDVPIRANVLWGKGKIRGLASTGISANFLRYREKVWHGQVHEIYDKLSEFEKKINFSPLIGVGFEYKLSDNFTLHALPVLKFGLKETFKNREYVYANNKDRRYIYCEETVNTKLHSFGIEISILYSMKQKEKSGHNLSKSNITVHDKTTKQTAKIEKANDTVLALKDEKEKEENEKLVEQQVSNYYVKSENSKNKIPFGISGNVKLISVGMGDNPLFFAVGIDWLFNSNIIAAVNIGSKRTEYYKYVGTEISHFNHIYYNYSFGCKYQFARKKSISRFFTFTGIMWNSTFCNGYDRCNHIKNYLEFPAGINYIAKSGFQTSFQLNLMFGNGYEAGNPYGFYYSYGLCVIPNLEFRLGWRFNVKKY